MRWHLKIRLAHPGFTLEVDEQGGSPVVAIVGPNGSGKTRLLQALCGTVTPDSGLISVDDRVFFDGARGVLCSRQDRHVGYVPQGSALFPHLSVLDNVLLPWRGSYAEGKQKALEALQALRCDALLDVSPARLSGGETQRVALVRALMRIPSVLILDEPMAAQDVLARKPFRDYFMAQQRQRDIPLFFVTHDARDVVATQAYVLVLNEGKVVEKGPVSEIVRRPKSAFSELFFGVMKE